MKYIRARLGSPADRQDGMTLVEVIVAMFIFSIISTGFIYGMISVLAITRDSRAIQVAGNLASEEIDLVRATDDLFGLLDNTRDVQLNGDTFHVARTTSWVSDPAVDLKCGSGGASGAGGALRYKRVAVTVTWDRMHSDSSAVNTFTVINPKTRINDPALGTILVSVLTPSGAGSSGITVTAAPAAGVSPNTAQALTVTPDLTDAQGCTYILKVAPGTYDVSVSRTGYVNEKQEAVGKRQVSATAGASSAIGFQYDAATTYNLNYAPAVPSAKIPTNLDTSFLRTDSTFVSTGTTGSRTRSVAMHPYTDGYSVIAGRQISPFDGNAGCVAVDPSAWEPVMEGAQQLVGIPVAAPSAAPGGTVSVDVPMGVFTVSGLTSATYLRAESVNATPACAGSASQPIVMNYQFGDGHAATATFALPYGSWKLFTGDSASQNSTVPSPRLATVTRGTVAPNNILTLDPRVVAAP